ncbi:MAG: DUF4097 family beta strand repeat protein [Clostridiales bacterium]|jgi:hypothetical protein|nr:DUF4097 family beta strand repeat protein [Clostridiales bacterium]
MKAVGKVALGFFIGFLVLLIAGSVVLSTTGTFDQLWRAIEDRSFYSVSDFSDDYEDGFPIEEDDMDYSDSKRLSLDGVKTIVIEANACQLQAQQEESVDQLSADFKSGVLFGDDYARMNIETKEDKLYIKIKQERKWIRWFRPGEATSFSKLDLRIPASYQGEIEWELNACDAKISHIKITEDMDVSLNAGRLELSEVKAKALEMDGNAAAVSLREILVNQKAEFSCSAGSLYGDLVTAEEISVDNNAAETKLERIRGRVESECSAGSVLLSFAQVTGDLDVHTSVGSTELIVPKESPIRVVVKGKSQEVRDHINWNGSRQYEMKNYQYTVTASGNASELVLREQ